MPLETNFNVSPFYDDYSETKNYHRILFRPSVPIQARELTQLQTILQNQIERFGDNIYQQGTIIKGCSFTFDNEFHYIKLKDLQVDGQSTLVSNYANTFLQDTANLKSVVVYTVTGLESQNPDLNTLYIKYLNTGTGDKKTYSNSDILTVYNRSYRVESVTINAGGTSYSNSDTLTFSGPGTGASANIVTYANGTIRSVVISNKGSGYTTTPNVTITTSTGTGANLTALNYIAQITIANSSFTAPVGVGYATSVSDGIIFQKGFFVRVDPQTTIVSKYTRLPNNLVLGFSTLESIVNNSVDTTLLDNAQGYPNFSAPGAYRLKLTPTLTVLSKSDATANADFFSLLEFENGAITKRRTETEFNSVNQVLAKRTVEESGNYVVKPFSVYTEGITGNTTHLNLSVGPGVGYISGYRVELHDVDRTPMRKGTNTATDTSQTISTNYGNYLVVNEFSGNFGFDDAALVSLRDTPATDVSDNIGGAPTTPGSQIGTARIRSLVYHAGTPGSPNCQYRAYLFDIKMSTGYSFETVRAISIAGTGVADVVQDSGMTKAHEADFDTLIFPSGASAVSVFNNEQFIYRAYSGVTFNTGGTTTITLSGADEFPYTAGSTLNDTQELDFIIIPNSSGISTDTKTGTVSTTGNTITGSGTAFITEISVDDYIKFSGNNSIYRIASIANNTSATIAGSTGPAVSGNTYVVALPQGIPVRLNSRATAQINIDSTGKIATLVLGANLSATMSANVYYNVKVDGATQRTKTVVKDVYVKLSTDKLANTLYGPWCLGIPDAFELVAVYVGSSNTYSNTTTNQISHFELDNGQGDNYYGLSYLKKKPGSTLTLTASNCLLVRLNVFTHGAGGYYISTESFPVDDVTVPLPANKIRTEDIPYFISPRTGSFIDQRDAIDFRPIVANTATLSTTVAGASVDPSNTITFAAVSRKFPTPNKEFEADIVYYLRRADRVVMDRFGEISIIEGIPSKDPSPPQSPSGTMSLATVYVPPYPSLSPKEAADSQRSDYATLVKHDQTRGYTMENIKNIEERVNRLEYYSLFNTLEKETKDLVIPSEANSELSRFKNGFFVDSLSSYDIANVNDNEFNIMIDTAQKIARPPILQHVINLQVNNSISNNIVRKGDLALLNYTHVEFLKQPIASTYRNLTGAAWSYRGTLTLFPAYDNYYDVNQSSVNVTIDLATPLNSLTGAVNDAMAELGGKTTITSSSQSAWTQVSRTGTTVTEQSTLTQSITETTPVIKPGDTVINQQPVGNFVSEFALNPYIRPQWVVFIATGLRPGARHYVFFDRVDVTSTARPGAITSVENININTEDITDSNDDFKFTGPQGANLVADTNGQLVGAFYVEENTFYCGAKNVLIIDVDDLDSEDASISKASTTFNAYNFNVEKSDVSVTTKAPTVFTTTSYTESYTTTQTLSQTRQVQAPQPLNTGAGGGGGGDPLSQTFNVTVEDGSDGVYITKVDLYFKQKDSTHGLNVQIRETENGYPTALILGQVQVSANSINVSNNASNVTTVTFTTPIFLKALKDYAICLQPEADSPDYLVWTTVPGIPDVANNNLISNKDWGTGVLFISTNNKAWTPVQSEDLKFTLYTAQFTSNSGLIGLHNGNYEFLTIANTQGSFKTGEEIAQIANSYIAATITCNTTSTTVNTSTSLVGTFVSDDYTLFVYGNNAIVKSGTVTVSGGSNTVTGSGTSFTVDYAVGDYVLINQNVREIRAITNATSMQLDAPLASAVAANVHSSVTESFNITKVVSVNTTALVLKNNPLKTVDNANTFASIQKVTRAMVDRINPDNTVVLRNSKASNTTNRFIANNIIIGEFSQARATIASVDDKTVNFIEPHILTFEPPGSSVELVVNVDRTTTAGSNVDIKFDLANKLPYEGEIKSKSNEVVSGSKSVTLYIPVARNPLFNKIGPIVDLSPISLVTIQNKINNDATNEHTRFGNSIVKYVSKKVVLADGLDAEDIKVFLTAYKPVGTDIKVYAKILCRDDTDIFEDKDWTLLTQSTSAGLFSDSLNEKDYKEFEYTFNTTPPATVKSGVVSTFSNTTITGFGTLFQTELAANDVIKVVHPAGNYDIAIISSITSNTALTTIANISFTTTGATIEKVTQKSAAFKYATAGGVVRYYSNSGALHSTYKVFAIKILLLAPTTNLVPVLKDIRALAVSI